MKRYRGIKLFDEDIQDLDQYMQEILDRRKLEELSKPAVGEADFNVEEAGVEAESVPEMAATEED
jgi:hypothetical protein